MFAAPRLINALPENAAVHVRVGLYRGPLGVRVLAPRIVIDNRTSR
ncbi:MAG: hypothetical protein J7513_13690 [Solirubrobacteraceae bacterium]|nr:hypothetical protein [Solirubrobacteraceae bacterium]